MRRIATLCLLLLGCTGELPRELRHQNLILTRENHYLERKLETDKELLALYDRCNEILQDPAYTPQLAHYPSDTEYLCRVVVQEYESKGS